MKPLCSLAAGLFLILNLFCSQAATVVAPGPLENVEGNSNTGFPFNLDPFGMALVRYQQVYASSEFSTLPFEGAFISQIAFRVDPETGASFSSTVPDIQINLSTTSAGPDTLDSEFAANIGPDDIVVFGRGPLALSGTGGASPNPFNIVITLDTPFLYLPSSGNLLLDIRNFAGGLTTQFDAERTEGDGIGSVPGPLFSSAALPTTIGLVTKFTFMPIPEPATLSLIGFGLAPLFLRRHRRNGMTPK